MPGPENGDRSIGEIGRVVDAFRSEMREHNDKIDNKLDSMSQTYVSRESFNLVTTGLGTDISRIDKRQAEIGVELAADHKERVTSTRWALGIGLTAIGLIVTSVFSILVLVVPHLVTK